MPGEQILIVEDNVKNLKLLRAVLRVKGYATIEAETGEAALALAREHKPALILMDIQLPGIDGREVMRILKAEPGTRRIPVVALTAFAMKGDEESLLAEGFDGYVSKPIDVRELPGLVESHLGRRP